MSSWTQDAHPFPPPYSFTILFFPSLSLSSHLSLSLYLFISLSLTQVSLNFFPPLFPSLYISVSISLPQSSSWLQCGGAGRQYSFQPPESSHEPSTSPTPLLRSRSSPPGEFQSMLCRASACRCLRGRRVTCGSAGLSMQTYTEWEEVRGQWVEACRHTLSG